MRIVNLKLLLVVLVLVCALPFEGRAQNQIQFPHTAIGGGYKTTFLLLNQRQEDTTVWFRCYRPDGRDWYISVLEGTTSYTTPFQFQFPRNSVRKLETTADSATPMETGWCQLNSSVSINGHLMFKFPYGETSILNLRPSCGFKVVVEFSVGASRTTGLAIASPPNPSGLPNRVRLDLLQNDGEAIMESKTIYIPQGGQEVAFVEQGAYFSSLVQRGEFLGSIKVQSEWPVTLTSVGWKNESGGIYFFNNTPPIDTRDTCSGPVKTLSQAAKEFVKNHGLSSSVLDGTSGVERWAEFPINLYAPLEFDRQQIMTATKFWENETNGKITFRIVEHPSEASVVFSIGELSVPNMCAVAGGSSSTGFELTRGVGYFNKAIPECWKSETIVHELGHVLGIKTHSPPNTDVMSAPTAGLKLSSVTRDIINWSYSVPVGGVVPQ